MRTLKKINPLITFLFCITAWGISSCTTSRPTASGSFISLYDFESYYLHPEFRIYHHKQDSSVLYFQFRSQELLYSRAVSSDYPEARVRIDVAIFPKQGDAIADTIHFIERDFQVNDGPKLLRGSKTIRLSDGEWSMSIRMTDLNRGVMQEFILNADKSSSYSAQNFLVRKQNEAWPLMNAFCVTGDTLILESARNFQKNYAQEEGVKISISQFEDVIKLPPPPFSSNNPEIPMAGEMASTIRTVGSEFITWKVKEGLTYFSIDSERKKGVTLSATNEFFPEVKSFDQLVTPLRYITSKAEFDEMQKSTFSKDLIDNFWVECAGSKDRARELIRVYYGRVEEANRYFSTYTEGWKTDRGMIHMIFGNPSRINRTAQSETWIYGEEGSAGSLSFVFRKMNSALSDNLYILQRDPMFRQSWEQMVTTWRQGRVFSD